MSFTANSWLNTFLFKCRVYIYFHLLSWTDKYNLNQSHLRNEDRLVVTPLGKRWRQVVTRDFVEVLTRVLHGETGKLWKITTRMVRTGIRTSFRDMCTQIDRKSQIDTLIVISCTIWQHNISFRVKNKRSKWSICHVY